MTLEAIQRRQVARLIDHLKSIGYDRPEIFAAVKRSYGYAFQDVRAIIDKDNTRTPEQGDNPDADE